MILRRDQITPVGSLRLFFAFALLVNCNPDFKSPTTHERGVLVAQDLTVMVSARGGQYSKSGAGLLISPQRVITCFHVVNHDLPIVVKFHELNVPAILLRTDKQSDLAELLLLLPIESESSPQFRDANRNDIGLPAFVLGSPFGLDSSLLRGSISALNRQHVDPAVSGVSLTQVQGLAYVGTSGSPVLMGDGKVVGLIRSAYGFASDTGLGFAIPAAVLLDFVNRGRHD